MIGQTLGSYQVLARLGAGGMGEVYRARDTQLKRDVAIKILPADVTADADRLARFQREAEMLASLNHPNIAQVFGVVDTDGVRGIVMELVEGEGLDQVVASGTGHGLPLDQALAIARQIAEALEAAHERGVIHRDLKPANVKVTPDGVVKVLDFGLAKALGAAHDVAASAATFSSPAMTRAGIILGTAGYMSPEQARGRAVDARTDVWAFGCVLFEMLTGRRPYDGETVTDILGAIVHKEPDWTLLPDDLPESLRTLLVRCLVKDPKQRVHNIADARLEIQDRIAHPRDTQRRAHGDAATTGRSRPSGRERLAWALAVAATVAAAALGVLRGTGQGQGGDATELPALRLSILPTEFEVSGPAISPDGRRVAYSARGADGPLMIWVRDLDQSVARSLAGTDDGREPFWSPDGRHLGFLTSDQVLKRVPAGGGPVQEVVREATRGGAWGPGDVILYSQHETTIMQVPAGGGAPTAVTTRPGDDWVHMWPSVLPDGRRFLFTAKQWTGVAESSQQGIYLGSLDRPSAGKRLLPDLSSAVYAEPGYLIFSRNGRLMAAPFDSTREEVSGDPVDLGEPVARGLSYFNTAVSLSRAGILALRPPPAPSIDLANLGVFEGELHLMARDGSVAARVPGSHAFTFFMDLAPDGRRAAVSLQDDRTGIQDIWAIDLASGQPVPLTSMRSGGGYAGSPRWSPEGTEMAYGCQLPGTLDDLCVRDMRTGAVTTLFQTPVVWEHPVAWSPDGRLLVYVSGMGIDRSLFVWSRRDNVSRPLVKKALTEAGDFSPDGRFFAYTSGESGRAEVMVVTFPEPTQAWSLTPNGGHFISWRDDGTEILVATPAGHIAAIPVNPAGGSFTSGTAEVLVRNVGLDAMFSDATRDHSRILIRVPKDADKDRGEIRLLFGWSRALKTPAP